MPPRAPERGVEDIATVLMPVPPPSRIYPQASMITVTSPAMTICRSRFKRVSSPEDPSGIGAVSPLTDDAVRGEMNMSKLAVTRHQIHHHRSGHLASAAAHLCDGELESIDNIDPGTGFRPCH